MKIRFPISFIGSFIALFLYAVDASAYHTVKHHPDSVLPVGKGGGDQRLQVSSQDQPPTGKTQLKIEEFTAGLTIPWSIAWLPNGDMLVTERPGRLRLVEGGGVHPEPIAGTPSTLNEGQAGYFDIVVSPAFDTDKTVYLSYAKTQGELSALAVVSAKLINHSFVDTKTIFTSAYQKSNAHYGGRMLFDAAGKLYVTTGEGYFYKDSAQYLDNYRGSVVRLNPDGSIPSDNPNWHNKHALPALFSKGHRNPQGLAMHPITSEIMLHEHGATQVPS